MDQMKSEAELEIEAMSDRRLVNKDSCVLGAFSLLSFILGSGSVILAQWILTPAPSGESTGPIPINVHAMPAEVTVTPLELRTEKAVASPVTVKPQFKVDLNAPTNVQATVTNWPAALLPIKEGSSLQGGGTPGPSAEPQSASKTGNESRLPAKETADAKPFPVAR